MTSMVTMDCKERTPWSAIGQIIFCEVPVKVTDSQHQKSTYLLLTMLAIVEPKLGYGNTVIQKTILTPNILV